MNVVVAWISQRGGNNNNLSRATAAAAAISWRWSVGGHVEGLHHFSAECV